MIVFALNLLILFQSTQFFNLKRYEQNSSSVFTNLCNLIEMIFTLKAC